MYIAVAAEGNNLASEVSQCFDLCKYLLIVNMSDMSVDAIKNESDISKEDLAKKVIEFDCEALITGDLNPTVFDILVDALITRYYGYGNSVKEALELMEKNELMLLRNIDGANGCSGNHH